MEETPSIENDFDSMHPSRERRQFYRYESNFRVDLLEADANPVADFVSGEAFNFSLEGLGVKIAHDIPIGTHVSLAVFSGERDSICLCEVVWGSGEGKNKCYGLKIKKWGFLDPVLQEKIKCMKRLSVESDPFLSTFSSQPVLAA